MGKVSIVVPVFDVADYVDDCMNSIVAQTYDNLEIILVNDGSTDGSGAKCDGGVKKALRAIAPSWARRLWGVLRAVKNGVLSAFYRAAGRFVPDGRVTCYCPCCDTRLRAWKVARFSERPDLYDPRHRLPRRDSPRDRPCRLRFP